MTLDIQHPSRGSSASHDAHGRLPSTPKRANNAHERLTLTDSTMIASYAEHIERYSFALERCRGKRVLDAGCGTGYGSFFLAMNGAASVLGIDIADDALAEASSQYRLPNLQFQKHDVEQLDANPAMLEAFDVVVNFENLEHVPHPEWLVRGAAKVLRKAGGAYITSTPNGEILARGEDGKPLNKFHVDEYTREQLLAFTREHFANISLFGQWITHSGKLRKLRAQELFDQLCESYYNPMSRLGRLIWRLVGRPTTAPPGFTAGMDQFPGDHLILPLESTVFRWPPETLIAVCENPL